MDEIPKENKRPKPSVEDGPNPNFKRTQNWVDFTFGYGGETALPVDGPGMPLSGGVSNEDMINPKNFDENFPIDRPDAPELEEGIPQDAQDNSVLGGFMNFMDKIVPDDMGGALRGDSGFIADVPFAGDLYQNTIGGLASATLSGGSEVVNALNWGAEQMNHLGAALVSWLPGGISTLTWDESHDVSFGQAFVGSMGQTAGRLERGEAELGDLLMMPFSLISLGAAQIDTDNIAQDKNFDILNKEQIEKAFGDGAGMIASGGLDAAWLIAADPTIALGGASTFLRVGAKASKFGGLTNQALRKINQVDDFSIALADDAVLIAELGIDGARSSGRLGAEGENLIAAMEGRASDLGKHIWVKGENASRQKSILGFLSETSVDSPAKAADLVSAMAGHAPSWNKIKSYDIDLFDRLSFATSPGVDNMITVGDDITDAALMGGLRPISESTAKYGDDLFKQAEEGFLDVKPETSFNKFEREFGTGLEYADDAVPPSVTTVVDDIPSDQIAGQLITRGGSKLGPKATRAANAYRRGVSRSQFATARKMPPSSGSSVSGGGHFVYDAIEKTAGSRPLTVIRWVGQGTPSGIVMLKGGEGERGAREVTNWLRKSQLSPEESTIYLNRFVGEKTEAGRALILREMEDSAVRIMAEKAGVSVERAEGLMALYNTKRMTALENHRKTETKFHYDPDTGEMVKLPSFYSEIDASVPMIDTKLFEKVINQNKILLKTGEGLTGLDTINQLWKVSVLLRLGYTQRNVVEGFLRSAATIGLVAANPKAIANLPLNAGRYAAMKRGIKVERNLNKEVNAVRSQLAETRLVLLDGKTTKAMLADATATQKDQLRKIDELTEQLSKVAADIKAKNAARVKTGVGPNEVAPGIKMPGAFDGPEGELARVLASSDKTQRNVIEGAAQRRIKTQSDSQDFVKMDPSVLTAEQMPEYFAYYAERINRRYIGDPFGKMILEDRSMDSIRKWFTTPEGRKYFDEIQATRNSSTNWQDVDSYISYTIKRLDYEVPPGSKLRAKTLEGKRLTGSEVNAAVGSSDLPIIPGRLEGASTKALLGGIKGGIDSTTNWAMKWLGTIPENNLLRHPFYNNIYKTRQKELYELAAAQGMDMGSALVKAKINKSAHSSALLSTKQTMYTIEELSNVSQLLRFVSPFFPAWENSIRTWGRIVYNNPAILGAGNIMWNIPNNLGWVVDEDGNQVDKSNMFRDENTFIVWPEPIANFLKKDFGPFTPGEALKTRQSGFNVIFPGNEPWFAGVGPMTQIPVALALRGKPEDQELIKQTIGENLYRQIAPNGNPNTDLVDIMLPTVARRVTQMWRGESSDSAYLTLKNNMVEDAYIKSQIEGKTLGSKEFKEIEKRVEKFWKWQVASAGVMFTQSSYNSPYKLQRDFWNKLIDDQSLAYQDKIDLFHEEFGTMDFDAITRSGSDTPTGLKPNLKTWERIYKNPSLMADLNRIDPKVVGMFANMGSFDDPFSYAVYGEFSGTNLDGKPIRSKLKPSELIAKNEVADGWREWNVLKDAAEQQVITLGLSSLQANGAEQIREILQNAENDISEKYPTWGIEKETYEDNLPKFIAGARLIVKNGKLLNEDKTVEYIARYLNIREEIVNKLSSRPSAEMSRNIKQIGHAAAFDFRQNDIGFADFYDQYFASDDFREI